MKTLDFSYNMSLQFDAPVQEHHFTIRCIPRDGRRQRIEGLTVEIYPNQFLSRGEDSFGNICIYGYAKGPHTSFSIRMTGRAVTGLSPYEEARERQQEGVFKYQTDITRPGQQILAFADTFDFPEGMPEQERALAYMHGLYEHFTYEPGVTGVETTAEEAMALGKGVCQDYAHILLSLCRIEHIPARYVVGLLQGEGQSHAWVEVWTEQGYWALDPTNNLVVDDGHIRISSGRDYRDCAINQGIFTGAAHQSKDVQVLVEEQ